MRIPCIGSRFPVSCPARDENLIHYRGKRCPGPGYRRPVPAAPADHALPAAGFGLLPAGVKALAPLAACQPDIRHLPAKLRAAPGDPAPRQGMGPGVVMDVDVVFD